MKYIVSIVVVILSGCTIKSDIDSLRQEFVATIPAGDVGVSINPMSVEDAVRLGILTSNGILTSRISSTKTENDVKIAKAAYFPELFIEASPNNDGSSLATGGVGLRYTIYDFGQRAADLAAAESSVQQAKFDRIVKIEETVVDVMQRYIDLSVDADKLRISRNYLTDIKELSSAVTARVKIGAASGVELNEMDAAVLNARAAIIDAEAEVGLSREALASLVGVVPRTVVPSARLNKVLETPSNIPDVPNLETYPRIAALNQELEVSRQQLASTKAGLFPRIGARIGVTVGLNNDGALTNNGVVAGPDLSNVYSLGGGRKEKVNNAALDVLVAERALAEERRKLNLEFVQSNMSLAASHAQIEKRKEIVSIRTKNAEIMFAEYEIGDRSLRDLTRAKESILDAQMDLITSLKSHLYAHLDVLAGTNLLSDRLYVSPE